MKNTKHISRITLLLIVLLLAQALASAATPKNIILLIGDGMGTGILTATRIAEGGPDHRLTIDTMPVSTMIATHSANSIVTDSAAAATALACGVKTNNGMLGMNPDKKRLVSILEAAESIGKSTGLVTTVTITHATPAAFGAHIENRSHETTIAEQLAQSDIEVLMGGGRQNFIPKDAQGSKREDSKDLLADMKSKGYAVVDDKQAMLAARSPKIIGLFWAGYKPGSAAEPTLPEMTAKAIETLSVDKDGFFLMVEGGQIDSAGHANDIRNGINQTVEFDAAVARALEFARKDGNTLVVVTADHETGGLAIKNKGDKLKDAWIDTGHTGNPVQLFAYGPGAEMFRGFMDNTDVPNTFARLWKVKIGLVD